MTHESYVDPYAKRIVVVDGGQFCRQWSGDPSILKLYRRAVWPLCQRVGLLVAPVVGMMSVTAAREIFRPNNGQTHRPKAIIFQDCSTDTNYGAELIEEFETRYFRGGLVEREVPPMFPLFFRGTSLDVETALRRKSTQDFLTTVLRNGNGNGSKPPVNGLGS